MSAVPLFVSPVMNVLVPLKVMPGWPAATFSPIHFIILCFLAPILVAAVIVVIGKTPEWLRERHAGEVEAGLAEPTDSAEHKEIDRVG